MLNIKCLVIQFNANKIKNFIEICKQVIIIINNFSALITQSEFKCLLNNLLPIPNPILRANQILDLFRTNQTLG